MGFYFTPISLNERKGGEVGVGKLVIKGPTCKNQDHPRDILSTQLISLQTLN